MRYVSHELRSPLNAISVGLYVLSQELSNGSVINSTGHSSPQMNHGRRNSGGGGGNSGRIVVGDRQTSQLARIRGGVTSAGSDGDSAMCVLEDVLNSCESMVTILDDLLVFNQIENSCFELKREKLEVVSLLKDAISPFYVVVSSISLHFNGS